MKVDEKPQIIEYLEKQRWTWGVSYYSRIEMIRVFANDIPVEAFEKVKSEGWSFEDPRTEDRKMHHFKLKRKK